MHTPQTFKESLSGATSTWYKQLVITGYAMLLDWHGRRYHRDEPVSSYSRNEHCTASFAIATSASSVTNTTHTRVGQKKRLIKLYTPACSEMPRGGRNCATAGSPKCCGKAVKDATDHRSS